MLRWRWVLVLWLLGGALTVYGVVIELKVRAAVGSGLYRVLAHISYGGSIDHYRWLSMLCVLLGPGLIALGYLCRRKGRKGKGCRQPAGAPPGAPPG